VKLTIMSLILTFCSPTEVRQMKEMACEKKTLDGI